MTPNEYQRLALRTEVTPDFVNDLEGNKSRSLARLFHAQLGMDTEQAELAEMLTAHSVLGKPFDRVNLLEENGDQLWYCALGLDAYAFAMQEAVDMMESRRLYLLATPLHGQQGANIQQGRLGDLLKKYFVYRKPFTREQVLQCIAEQLRYISISLDAAGYTLMDAAERNIQKLQKRYPGKFTEERALNRDLAAERAILEGA
jgi:hypothetical protein